MSVQDDKTAGREEARQTTDKDSDQNEDRRPTEKPEPDEQDKKRAAEMMTAYEDRPTLVLPGSGGMVSGTAVNDWLDEDGNPKFEVPDGAGPDHKAEADEARNDEAHREQIEKDKALNEELKKTSAAEHRDEKR